MIRKRQQCAEPGGGRVFRGAQVARIGADAETLEDFWMMYRHPELLDRESLFLFLFCG